MYRVLSLLIVLLFLLVSCLQAEPREKKEEPLELLHADFSDLRMEKDNVILNLNGNVHFRHGNTELHSDRAVWYRSSGLAIFMGSVKVEEPEQSLSAEKVTYYQKLKKIVADEDVKLESKKEKTIVRGGHAEYDRSRKYAFFTQSPSLIYNPETEDSSLTITADTLEYLVELKRGVARGGVHIQKGAMEAFCEKAEIFGREERIVLSQNPSAKRENSELSGEEMEVLYKDNKIFKIEVAGQAKATHRELADSSTQRYNESFLSGKKIYFLLGEDEKLKTVKVLNNATSLYYPSTSDTDTQTRNEASGDSLELALEGEKLKRITIIGGAIGSYYFPPEERDSLHSEDTVSYSAEKIAYKVEENQIDLEDNCFLKYRQVNLKAGKVVYDTEKEYLKAEGIYQEEEEERKLSQLPALVDGTEELKGEEMSYYLNTRKGKVKAGRTDFQGGYYYGTQLGKIEENIFLASGGSYTTCDQNTPHFHFYSQKMKIIAKDKVIARPVVMYLYDIPVAAIPFYVFPIKPGRHSGFLTFEVGNFISGEGYVRNLGYYWAPSDYWDLETSVDYYENSGWLLKEYFRYAKRYLYSGSISSSYKRDKTESGFHTFRTNRWDLVLSHSHNISPVTKLSASGRFVSDNTYYRDYSFDAEERRDRSIHSSASLSTKYSEAGIYIALDQLENLDENSKTLKLPTFRISKSSFSLFKSAADQPKRWYQSLYLSFSSSFQNYYSKTELTEGFTRKKFSTLDNSISLSFPQKLFGYIVLSPSFNYRGSFYYVFETDQSEEKGIKANSFAHRSSYSLGLNASTTIYGTFSPKIGPVSGIRQVITPSLGFSFVPGIKKHLDYVSYTGVGSGSSKAQSLNFSLSHLLQVKTQKEGKEKKFELFGYTLSSGYNFLAQEHKLSNLSSRLWSNAIPGINFELSFTHDPYNLVTKELQLSRLRLLNLSLSTSLFHRGTLPFRSKKGEQEKSRKGYVLSLSHRYSETREATGIYKNHWLSLSLDFWLTEKWHISYDTRYDFTSKELTEQSFVFRRDLHCWEGSFTWITTGYREGYYFRINIKALPEVKVEKGMAGLRELIY